MRRNKQIDLRCVDTEVFRAVRELESRIEGLQRQNELLVEFVKLFGTGMTWEQFRVETGKILEGLWK